MKLVVVGLSHRTAPLDVRERLVYDRDEVVAALQHLRAEHDLSQSLLLSTCNRTELYAVGAADDLSRRVRDQIFTARAGDLADGVLYTHDGGDAVGHLYRVACGLDSLVIGEQQILGQVKDAYELSQRAKTAGSVLHRMVQGAFRAGKRSRTETAIGMGAVSVASIAVELAEKVYESLAGKRALLIGAGENGEHCARHLIARDIESLTITNRTVAKAEALALELGGGTAPFGALADALAHADIVISTTGAPEPIIDADLVRRAMRTRGHTAMVILDIAVPRDVAPAVDHIANAFLFDMDALTDIAEKNFERRRNEIPKVEKLIGAEVDTFLRWWGNLDAGPVIRDLHKSFDAIRAHELGKNSKRFADEDQEQLDLFSRNLVRKLLMGVTQEIKTYRRDNLMEMERLAALRDLFHLADPPAEEDNPGDD